MNDSIRELMDSCRPLSDDLQQPEMRPLAELMSADAEVANQFARSQGLDAAISATVHDVPIPVGLEQRLLAALDSQQGAMRGEGRPADAGEAVERKPVVAADITAVAADSEAVTVPRPAKRFGGWRLWTAVATTAAAVGLFFLFGDFRPPPPISGHALEAAALNWQLDDEGWTDGPEMWTRHPLPSRMLTRQVKRRQAIWLNELGVDASCYELAMPAGSSARIFVFSKPAGVELPAAPPRAPVSTRGTTVAAWTRDGFAYVLVLHGGDDAYRNLFRRGSQLAVRQPARVTSCSTRTA